MRTRQVFISAHGQVREQRHGFARTVFKSFFTNTHRWCAEELNPHVDYPKKERNHTGITILSRW